MVEYSQTELLKIAKVSGVTFNTWRNRNGLFPHTTADRKWNKYSISEVCQARTVVLLSRGGLGAQDAIACAMLVAPFFEEVCKVRSDRLFSESFAIFDGLGSETGPRVRFVDRTELLHNMMAGDAEPVFVGADLYRIVMEVMVSDHQVRPSEKLTAEGREQAIKLYDQFRPQPHPDYDADEAA